MLLTIEGTNYVSADVFTDGKKCSSYSNAVISDHEMQGWIIVETGQLITIHSRVRSSQVMCQVDLVVDGVIRNSTIHGLSGRGNPPAQASIHTFYTAAYQAGEGQEQREMYAQPLNLDSKHTPGLSNLGTIEIRVSIASLDGTTHDVDTPFWNQVNGEGGRSQATLDAVQPDNLIGFIRPTQKPKTPTRKHLSSTDTLRDGPSPYAVLRFYYRSKATLAAAGLLDKKWLAEPSATSKTQSQAEVQSHSLSEEKQPEYHSAAGPGFSTSAAAYQS
ncbi:MAG: hypothetical protein MMC33_007169 [Icmadophila ericetorum]|nr:hypothetical protein [Icmadophila ericetorum]